ncbi:MAG TPA: xanthine dehydrogenase family protein molybdopterin-binding subunit [Gemmatimonadales bacterium]|nr:xanthine dehydrogenase family protein molybdopterin-binding subunit [Gemmatimonadales bacterium]
MTTSLTRREFLRAGAAAGAGLTIAVYLPSCTPGAGKPVTTPFSPNAWVRISTDGSVTLVVDRSEMGQGVYTALPMLLAEELDVPWEAVRVEQAGAGKEYYNSIFPSQVTGGSTSVRSAWKPLREAGARARVMLVAAAAAAWTVDPSQCTTENGVVLHPPTRRRLKYGELAERAAAQPVPDKVTLKEPKDFKYIGTSVPRLDLRDKVCGRAVFGMDVETPGLLVAVVARCPVFGGSAKSWDEAAAKQVPGVKQVVKLSSGVAVLADGYWAAHKGREALKVVWDEGPAGQFTTESMRRDMVALVQRPGLVAKKTGTGALARGGKQLSAVYEAPYLAHACMEPMNTTAHVEADKCTVWAPTQYQCGPALGGGVQEVAARIAGLDPSKVAVHTTFLGGGFGRRVMHDFVVEAVEASKAAGAPVKAVWSREDDIQHDFYRPPTYGRFAASLDAEGTPTALVVRVVCPSIMASAFGAPKDKLDDSAVEAIANLPYDIPNLLVEAVHPDWAVPLGFWRSVGSSQNGFQVESFLDELAWAAGKDPVDYRRALLKKKPRHLAVLELAAAKGGWGTPLPAGRARGVAVVESFDSYVAEVAEVSLNPDRTVRVHRVVAAVDCGTVVNPDIVAAQVEGSVVYGLTAALHGEITIDRGRVAQSNFHDYPLLRMREMPAVEVHLVPSTEAPTGIGEPGTPPIAPAVANAVFALTKQRIRKLPLGAVPA